MQSAQAVCRSTSEFRGLAPATKNEVAPLLARLAVAFPSMNQQFAGVSFWTVLGEQLADEQWSEARVRYAVNYMLKNYQYKTFTIADFLKIDKDIPHWTSAEAETLPDGHKPLAMANFGDRWWVCYQEDAERLGLEHKEWRTNKDMKYKVEDFD